MVACHPVASLQLSELPRVDSHRFRPPRIGASPCVVAGIAKDWNALSRWTADYLTSVAGEADIVVRRIAGAPTNIYLRQESTVGNFGQFLEWVVQISGKIGQLARETVDIPALMAAVEQMGIEESYYLDVP